MLFSCKITHSIINYLDRRGEDLEAFYETCDWPAEFLRDPSSWLEAEKMESVLRQLDENLGDSEESEHGLINNVGHLAKDLRGWGVLDSVLRMVQSPKDLYAQPERFLSYFISPAPPVGDLRRENERVSFVLPISDMQFPYVTSYLRAALEALPTYIAKPMANVVWDNSLVTITWSDQQASLFGEGEAPDLSLNPDLVRTVVHDLEASQKELEESKRALLQKDTEIRRLKSEAKTQNTEPCPPQAAERIDEVLHDLYRLGDYVARGHQLITLLIGQGRQTPQVQEAMRRVDWEIVSQQGPQIVRKAVTELQKFRDTSLSGGADERNHPMPSPRDT